MKPIRETDDCFSLAFRKQTILLINAAYYIQDDDWILLQL